MTHKNLTISIEDPNDRHLIHMDPDTDEEVNDMAAAMGDMGGVKKGLQEPSGLGGGGKPGDPPAACCVLF